MYVSNLKHIDRRRLWLAERLKMRTAGDGDLHDWTDALEYLTREKTACARVEQAKTALIAALSGSAPWGGM